MSRHFVAGEHNVLMAVPGINVVPSPEVRQ
jgi:hypothetical protein